MSRSPAVRSAAPALFSMSNPRPGAEAVEILRGAEDFCSVPIRFATIAARDDALERASLIVAALNNQGVATAEARAIAAEERALAWQREAAAATATASSLLRQLQAVREACAVAELGAQRS